MTLPPGSSLESTSPALGVGDGGEEHGLVGDRLSRGLGGRGGDGEHEVEVVVGEGLGDRGRVGLFALGVLHIPVHVDAGIVEGLLEAFGGGVSAGCCTSCETPMANESSLPPPSPPSPPEQAETARIEPTATIAVANFLNAFFSLSEFRSAGADPSRILHSAPPPLARERAGRCR